MKLTLGVVVTLWTFTAALVTAALALNRNKNFSFMGPTPVSPLNSLLPNPIDLYVVLVLG